MAKIGTYSYPDIRFGDAVEIAGRILAKFKGVVSVKGLAWELGMAENSGTLFAKVAALRDFGLVEGRGELRISDLCRRIIHPTNPEEGRESRIHAFQRVDLLRSLYERFQGEAPDDSSLMVALEELTKAPREEIVRRFILIQKHLADAARVMRYVPAQIGAALPSSGQQIFAHSSGQVGVASVEVAGVPGIYLNAGDARLNAPLTSEYIDVAINLLRAMKVNMESVDSDMAKSSPD